LCFRFVPAFGFGLISPVGKKEKEKEKEKD
jgi:hypothetical protein